MKTVAYEFVEFFDAEVLKTIAIGASLLFVVTVLATFLTVLILTA